MIDPFKTDLEQSRQILRRFALARAFIISVVAAYCAVLQARNNTLFDLDTAYLFVVIAIALIESFVVVAIIAAGHAATMRFSSFLLCADLVQISAIIVMTGGSGSVFVFLYIALILSASLLYSFTWSLSVATACSIFFVGTMILELNGLVVPASAFRLGEANQAGLQIWADIAMKIFAFYLTAFLGGLLSHRVGLLQSFHENILNSLSSGYISVNRDGTVTYLNPAASMLLKRSRFEAVGQDVSQIFPVAENQPNPLMEAISKKRESNSREIAVIRGDTKKIPVGITVSPIFNGSQRLLGAVGSFIDLTELKRMEEMLRRADRLAAVGEMSAALAHEIRNPVASVRSAVEELSENVKLEATNEQLMSIAMRECDQLGRIVSRFLEFVGIETAAYEHFDVAQLLQEVAEAAERAFPNGNIRIQRGFPMNLGYMRGDRTRLREALLNVIRNGREAMPEGGALHITADACKGDRNAICIVVQDEGKGVSSEELPRLFDPFFTTKPDGTGLGLAIVHKIISSHNGSIDIESTAGRGTRVNIVLPRQDEGKNG